MKEFRYIEMQQYGEFFQIWKKLQKPSVNKLKWQGNADANLEMQLESSIPHIVGLKINFFLQNGEFQNDVNSALPHIVGFLGTSPFCWNLYNADAKLEVQLEIVYSSHCRIKD